MTENTNVIKVLSDGGEKMIKYMLTSIFQTKFGTGKKYYDGGGWHWMLNSDIPKFFPSYDSARREAALLSVKCDVIEVHTFPCLYEHKIPHEEMLLRDSVSQGILFEKDSKEYHIYLAEEKEDNRAIRVTGLYCIDREMDLWVFSEEGDKPFPSEEREEEEEEEEEDGVVTSYKYLVQAKTMLKKTDEKKEEIGLIDSVLLFLSPFVDERVAQQSNGNAASNIKECYEKSYDYLKNSLVELNNKKGGEEKKRKSLEGVLFLVRQIKNASR